MDLRLLRRLVHTLLDGLLRVQQAELGVCLVSTKEITRLNETFLRHSGPTDVIAFDYAPHPARQGQSPARIQGEVFVCVDEAVRQGRRYRTPWQAEVVRYVVHGVLHLLGHEDQSPAARAGMKRLENQLLAQLGGPFRPPHFPLSR